MGVVVGFTVVLSKKYKNRGDSALTYALGGPNARLFRLAGKRLA